MRVAVVGAGWAGLAAAVSLTRAGAAVSLFDLAPQAGGRARSMTLTDGSGSSLELDNGQHILIGAYAATLGLMRTVGVEPKKALLRLPLSLPYPDGSGFITPNWAGEWSSPWNALAAVLSNGGWTLRDKWSFIRTVAAWRSTGFKCATLASVSDVCGDISPKVMADLIDPLCVSALNLPANRASGAIFLRVMHDAMLGPGSEGYAASDLLVPRLTLGYLLPEPALLWLDQQGVRVTLGAQVTRLETDTEGSFWTLHIKRGDAIRAEAFDRVVWATNATTAARTLSGSAAALESVAQRARVQAWADAAAAIDHTAIGTVYVAVDAKKFALPSPMVALPAAADMHLTPAQFVFDRGEAELSTTPSQWSSKRVWAMVASDCQLDTASLTAACMEQLRNAFPLLKDAQHVKTVVEKRATFACAPGLVRPAQTIAPGLYAAGDYVDGPYPATLEGAVQSGESAALACLSDMHPRP